VFSCGLILYGSLFSSAEAAFLLSQPLDDDQVFAYKFQGAVAFSSWAFLLLGGPVLIAYGIVCHAPWSFYVLFLPLSFLGFILLPGPGVEQRPVLFPDHRGRGSAPLPPRLQPFGDGRHHPPPLRWRIPRQPAGRLLALHPPRHAPVDRQGLPHLPPRPAAVGAG